MKKDSLKVFFKVFVRLFSILAYLGSSFWSYYVLDKLALPEIVSHFAGYVIIFGHLGLLVALWKEFSGQES